MTKERVFVPDEVRESAIEQILHGRSRRDVAAELNVSLATVHLWMAKARTASKAMHHEPGTFAPVNPEPEEYSTDYLKMRIRQLEIDIEHLKEAWAVDVKNLKRKLAVYEGNDPVFEGTEVSGRTLD